MFLLATRLLQKVPTYRPILARLNQTLDLMTYVFLVVSVVKAHGFVMFYFIFDLSNMIWPYKLLFGLNLLVIVNAISVELVELYFRRKLVQLSRQETRDSVYTFRSLNRTLKYMTMVRVLVNLYLNVAAFFTFLTTKVWVMNKGCTVLVRSLAGSHSLIKSFRVSEIATGFRSIMPRIEEVEVESVLFTTERGIVVTSYRVSPEGGFENSQNKFYVQTTFYRDRMDSFGMLNKHLAFFFVVLIINGAIKSLYYAYKCIQQIINLRRTKGLKAVIASPLES